jgi:AcrR family transcriptional regulator
MPKFTETEFETIKGLIFDKGRELFIQYGLKKTSIDEIVQACDIAKGSFYKFYDSKEELYFEILKTEEEGYQTVIDEVMASKNTGQTLMICLIKQLWFFYKNNQFLQLLYERKELPLLLRKIPLEEIQEYSSDQRLLVIRTIETIQQEKKMAQVKPEIVEGIIRGILILSAHEQEIGRDVYREVMDKMIQFVGEGLGSIQ